MTRTQSDFSRFNWRLHPAQRESKVRSVTVLADGTAYGKMKSTGVCTHLLTAILLPDAGLSRRFFQFVSGGDWQAWGRFGRYLERAQE